MSGLSSQRATFKTRKPLLQIRSDLR
jgi:hypothetical protein